MNSKLLTTQWQNVTQGFVFPTKPERETFAFFLFLHPVRPAISTAVKALVVTVEHKKLIRTGESCTVHMTTFMCFREIRESERGGGQESNKSHKRRQREPCCE